MMGQSRPSACRQNRIGEESLLEQMVELPFQETSSCWRNGETEALWHFTQGDVKSISWGKICLCWFRLGVSWLERRLLKKALRVQVDIKLGGMSQLWTPRAKISSTLGCIRKVEWGDLPNLLSTGETHLQCYIPVIDIPAMAPQYQRDMDTSESSKGLLGWLKGLLPLSYKKDSERSGFV